MIKKEHATYFLKNGAHIGGFCLAVSGGVAAGLDVSLHTTEAYLANGLIFGILLGEGAIALQEGYCLANGSRLRESIDGIWMNPIEATICP